MQSLKKRAWILAVSLALVTGFVAGSLTAGPQPNMTAALALLGQAKSKLQNATADKGGHRVKAIALINQAISEVEAGIAADK